MTIRQEILEKLKEVCANTFAKYPNERVQYPCIVFNASTIAKSTLDSIGYREVTVDVQIYCNSQSECSQLELEVQNKMNEIKYINTSSQAVSDPKVYRSFTTYQSIR